MYKSDGRAAQALTISVMIAFVLLIASFAAASNWVSSHQVWFPFVIASVMIQHAIKWRDSENTVMKCPIMSTTRNTLIIIDSSLAILLVMKLVS
jgi:1,4-dihydroxy-2-naphthoate octaprenyltransferase